ncbi:cyclic dehypoxanthinyl futalosine synthase [Desulforhopalus sp. IMCC35007]|uniref:cyclic dehypoxanthinyl futalosine synthase n=1 Tax=Desulforhopalus sp. IMCC35007 TaxID=2569543 RepID=UPI0010ADE53A|nr:cyclic dehypoxanthinyl futalosine synthase [Desulforhopalus sp. IMCC35007]TKB11241.1 dehypoxanthine futalosine cyclase [Desulforhopalus sp. IMCC35007]
MVQSIIDKVEADRRISDDDYRTLEQSADLHTIGFLADMVRRRKHTEKNVTYVIDRNINYTDICVSACKFCAFYKGPEDDGGYLLSFEEIGQKIKETQDLGGTQILLQGGLHPDLPLEYYEKMVRYMRETGIHVHGFSPPEIHHFAQISELSLSEVIQRLMDAGLGSIPGGGAEILSDRVRQLTAPKKCTADEWIKVMTTAHGLGLKTTATMMFGHLETKEERLEHLRRIRNAQDKTHGFTAFIPWPFQPDNTLYADLEKTSAFEYLKTLALSRIYLDNFDNIQASWVTQGPKVAQLSLAFGANDFGSTMIEENVVAAAGVSFRLTEQEIRRLVTDAGFVPRQRLMDYTLVD